VDLAAIVYQGEPRTRPLYIHFQLGPQREAVHVLVYTDVGKDRLKKAGSFAIPGGLQPGVAIFFPCSISILAFSPSIRFGCSVSTSWTERYACEVMDLHKPRAFSGQAALLPQLWVRLFISSSAWAAAYYQDVRVHCHSESHPYRCLANCC
jgi:hypothetical protein